MSRLAPPPRSHHSAVRRQFVRLGDGSIELIMQLASETQTLMPATSMRVSLDDLERVFGDAEVQIAVMAAPDLRYLYANAAYHAIRPGVAMVGRTYREIFPEAAEGGAEQRLQSVIGLCETWIVDDYPTWLPNRSQPAWWQGECVPIDLQGHGAPDGALILLWEVTHRHIPDAPRPMKSEARLRIEAAKVKLAARMAAAGLDAEHGWHISEELRETEDATVWALRPIHMQRVAPPSLVELVEFPRFGL
jgi:PAS fold